MSLAFICDIAKSSMLLLILGPGYCTHEDGDKCLPVRSKSVDWINSFLLLDDGDKQRICSG